MTCCPPRSCCQSLLVVAIHVLQAKATDSSRNKEISSQPSKRFYSLLFPKAPCKVLEEEMSFGS